MVKFFCDICKNEIVKENSLFGNFTYFVRKTDFLVRRLKENAVQVEMMLCEDCVKIMKEYLENLAKDCQKV